MKSQRKSSIAACFVVSAFALLGAQDPAFEVASIKENQTKGRGGWAGMRPMPDGGVMVQFMSARALITQAFGLLPYQMIENGAPSWIRDTYYDINAKPSAPVPRDQTMLMVRSLLADRFKLTYHRETREMEGYELLRARADRLGPNLKVSALDCELRGVSRPQGCEMDMLSQVSIKTVGTSLATLVRMATFELEAAVIDRTGLDGRYDIDLQWTKNPGPSSELPVFSTAIQEQLGLKVERRRMPVEVFVIDSIERPTPD